MCSIVDQFIYSLVDGQFLSNFGYYRNNRAAVNIFIKVFAWTNIFLSLG